MCRVCLAEETHRSSGDHSAPYSCNEVFLSHCLSFKDFFSVADAFQLFTGKENQSNRRLRGCGKIKFHNASLLPLLSFFLWGMCMKCAKVEIMFEKLKIPLSSSVYLKLGFLSFPVSVFKTKEIC